MARNERKLRFVSQEASVAPHFSPTKSAREDAINSMPHKSARLRTLVLATLAGISLGVVIALVDAPSSIALFQARTPWSGGAPTAREWSEIPRAGESALVASVPDGFELQVFAPRGPRARRLAAGIATRREGAFEALEDARAALTGRWQSAVVAAPLPELAPAAECASLLLADAARRTDLVAALPSPYAAGAQAAPAPADAFVARAEAGLEEAVAAADADASRRALLALVEAEDSRFARGLPEPRSRAAERGAAWRRAQLDRADSLVALANRALAGLAPEQKALATAAAPERLVLLAASLPDPYAPLASLTPAPPVTVEPLPGPWGMLLGVGGALGGAIALLAALLGLWLRRAAGDASASYEPARDPSAGLPWLHIVAGPSPAGAVRAALELAAHAIARRERVLVVDASGVRLHERLGREARWGLMECLQGDMPVLGLVQYAGRPGFYLLARGHVARTAAWAGLGRCMDDARLHFGRVIFVVDRTTPREFGDALVGRPLEGWWGAAVSRLPQAAVELSGRLGIAFSGIDLARMPKVSLELLSARVVELAAALPAPSPAEAVEVLEPEPLPLPEPPEEPIVLDCDLQVRQRLRFLAWMRRVQSEGRQAEGPAAPR